MPIYFRGHISARFPWIPGPSKPPVVPLTSEIKNSKSSSFNFLGRNPTGFGLTPNTVDGSDIPRPTTGWMVLKTQPVVILPYQLVPNCWTINTLAFVESCTQNQVQVPWKKLKNRDFEAHRIFSWEWRNFCSILEGDYDFVKMEGLPSMHQTQRCLTLAWNCGWLFPTMIYASNQTLSETVFLAKCTFPRWPWLLHYGMLDISAGVQ